MIDHEDCSAPLNDKDVKKCHLKKSFKRTNHVFQKILIIAFTVCKSKYIHNHDNLVLNARSFPFGEKKKNDISDSQNII
jgi:hypothetical protein